MAFKQPKQAKVAKKTPTKVAKRKMTTKKPVQKKKSFTSSSPFMGPSLVHTARRGFSDDKQKKGDKDDEQSIADDADGENNNQQQHAEEDPLIAFKQRIKKQNNEIDSLKKQLNDQSLIIEEWKTKSKALQERVKQEIEEQNNIHERYRREIGDVKKFAVGKFAKSILEGVDALEAAAKATEAALERNKDDSFIKLAEGLQMTTNVFHKVLNAEGIQKYESLGLVADPDRHFITAQLVHPSAPAGTITHILKEGYTIGGERILRPASVCVAKAQDV